MLRPLDYIDKFQFYSIIFVVHPYLNFDRNSIILTKTEDRKMNGQKRGKYFQYLNIDENASPAKIPRQTQWNRKQKVKHCTHCRHT